MYLGKKEILNLTELEKITRKLGVYWELELDDLQVRKDFLYRDYADVCISEVSSEMISTHQANATSLEECKAIADTEVYKEIDLFGYFFDNSVTDITEIQQTLAVYDPEDYYEEEEEYDPNYVPDPTFQPVFVDF